VGGISSLFFHTKYTRECRPPFAACGTPDQAFGLADFLCNASKGHVLQPGAYHAIDSYRHASTFACWRILRRYRDILPQSSAALATEFQQFFPNQIVSYATPALQNIEYFAISYVREYTEIGTSTSNLF
jgi:hypothetical protein